MSSSHKLGMATNFILCGEMWPLASMTLLRVLTDIFTVENSLPNLIQIMSCITVEIIMTEDKPNIKKSERDQQCAICKLNLLLKQNRWTLFNRKGCFVFFSLLALYLTKMLWQYLSHILDKVKKNNLALLLIKIQTHSLGALTTYSVGMYANSFLNCYGLHSRKFKKFLTLCLSVNSLNDQWQSSRIIPFGTWRKKLNALQISYFISSNWSHFRLLLSRLT